MSEEKLNCPECLRYASDNDTEHHQYCPTVADDPEKAKKDYARGWLAYCGSLSKGLYHVERENLPIEDVANPYFMVGYNVASLVDDEAWGGVEDLHINKLKG
jgi:hypothetical protein